MPTTKSSIGASEIANSLYSQDFVLRTLGRVVIDYPSVVISHNAVVCRACIDGSEGGMLLKCYCRHLRSAREAYGQMLRRNELGIALYNGDMRFLDVVAMPWVDGTPLNIVLNYVEADYALLSRKFAAFARKILNDDTPHGDITPMNIIVDDSGDMRLIDFDAVTPSPYLAQYAQVCRRSSFANHSDDYALAQISATLALLLSDAPSLCPYLQENGTLGVAYANDTPRRRTLWRGSSGR